MKWYALLFLGVLAEGAVAPECASTQTVDDQLIATQYTIGALSVPVLNIRNTAAAAETFRDSYITIHIDHGLAIATSNNNQIVSLGQGLIDAIEGYYANLKESIKQASNKYGRSGRINKSLEQINEQLETFLELKPGTQKVKSELRDLPPKPEFKSDNKNLTLSQAFLHLAETTDAEWAAVGGYASALHWYGWRRVRGFLDLVQTQYRNEILNNQVLPVYRKIVDEVYSLSDIQNWVDQETWGRFVDARKSIVKASNKYIESLETGEKCS